MYDLIVGHLPWIIGVVIPILVILMGAFSRKIVRGGTSFFWSDWYLGIELTLAAFSAMLTYLLVSSADQKHQLSVAALLGVAFVLYVSQIALHQTWQSGQVGGKRTQVIIMAGGSNMIGLALFIAFGRAIAG